MQIFSEFEPKCNNCMGSEQLELSMRTKSFYLKKVFLKTSSDLLITDNDSVSTSEKKA